MKSTLLLKAVAVALLITACSSEDSANSAKTTNSTARLAQNSSLAALQAAANRKLIQHYTFTSGKGSASITTKSGVTISINTSTLTLNGQPVTGQVDVQYVEIFTRGHMVTANKTTMGVADPDDQSDATDGTDLWPLESGGEFYVNMSQNGQPLDNAADFSLSVPASLTGGADPNMLAWSGAPDPAQDNDIAWQKQTDAAGTPIPVGGGGENGGNYNLHFNNFGWANIDRFSSYTGPKTTILVDVPAGYDDTNCIVYLATQGTQNLMARLDRYDAVTELFSEHYGQVPVGLQGYIIFISATTTQWNYAIYPVTFTAGGTVTVNASDILSTTQSNLETIIDALP